LILRAKKRLATRVAKIVIGIYARNLPVIHGRVSIGKNTTILARELVIFGFAYCLSLGSSFNIFRTLTLPLKGPQAEGNENKEPSL